MACGEDTPIVWDSLLDYGKLEWKRTLMNLGIASYVAYEDVLKGFDSVWCIECLILTHSNLVVKWKNSGIISARFGLLP
jgi:hypothetical protein